MSPRRLILIPLALALVLGACSSDDSSKGASGTGATGTEATSGTTPPVPTGFTEVDRSKDGFVIALPPGWKNFDLTSADIDSIVGAALQANPSLQPVKVTTTQNVDIAKDLTAGATLEGKTLAANDRVDVKAQTDASQNGVYVVQASGPAQKESSVADAVKALVDQGGLLYASDTSNPGKFLTNVNLIKVQGVEGGLGLLQQQAQSQLTAAGATNVSSSQVQLPAGDAVRTTYTVPVTLADGTQAEIAGLQVYFLNDSNLFVLTFSTDNPDKYSQTFDQIIATFSPV